MPFLRIVMAISSGIVCHEFFHIPDAFVISIVILTLILAVFFAFPYFKELLISYNQFLGFGVLLCLFFLSYWYVDVSIPDKPDWPVGTELVVQARLLESPREREKSYRVEAEILHYDRKGIYQENGGKILLYFSKNVDCKNWLPGDEVTFAARLDEIDGPRNPNEFDLRKYNARKGIYHRAFIRTEQLLGHDTPDGFSFGRYLHVVRTYLLSLLEKRFNSPTEKALSDALVLGYQDDLDEETVSRFSRSGTSHVLAVSGLHIGILWWAIDQLLFILNRRKSLRIVKFVLSMGILWGYALLTGLSPSILRAAIMFSCFAAAGLVQREYISLNILCASATAQMIIDPMVIFHIGFQLSYAAVAGILIFYTPIKNALYFKKVYLSLLWETTALTLSAQVLTTPISLYWFGQFPVWFLLSNLLLVPLSSLALGEGLLAFALSFVPYLNDLSFHLFMLSIKLMDTLAAFFAELPYALLFFNVGMPDVILLYILIGSVSMFIYRKTVVWFRYTLITVSCFLLLGLVRNYQINDRDRLVVYALKQGTVIRYFSRHDVYEYVSEKTDRKSYSYSVKPSDRLYDVRHKKTVDADSGFLSIGKKNVVLLQPRHLSSAVEVPVICDWIVVEAMKFIDFDVLQHNFRFKKLIIGSGNTWKSKQFWKRECAKREIEMYDLSENGAMMEMLSF